MEAAVEPARQSLVRAVGSERGGRLQGIDIPPRLAQEINSQKRQQSTAEKIEGVFRVSKVDTTMAEGFRVTFASIETGEDISASLEDAVLSEEAKIAMQRAEWSKQPVRVRLRVRKLRNRYVDAVVMSVEPIDSSLRAAPSANDFTSEDTAS